MFPLASKILIVDDFATMRKIIKKSLSELGYNHIDEASDGSSALSKLHEALRKNEAFQLIVSDWGMEPVSGFDLLQKCRANPQLKDLPFLLITADSDKENIQKAGKAGVSDCIVKPFTPLMLKQKLEKIWNRHSQSRPAA